MTMNKQLLPTALFLLAFLSLPSRGIADSIQNLVVFGDGFSTHVSPDVTEVWVESLAAALGADLYNYASTGATTTHIQEQMDSMSTVGNGSTLYIVWAVANDLRGILDGTSPDGAPGDAASNVGVAIQSLVDTHRARKVVVPNVPNLGVVPGVYFPPDGDSDEERASSLSREFNAALKVILEGLTDHNRKLTIYDLDANSVLSRYPPGTQAWSDLFCRDGFHPSDEGHRLLAVAAKSAVDRKDPVTIRWPSPEYPTLRSAVAAMEDGWVLKIAPGEFEVEAPMLITRKRVVIKGAGSGRNPKKPATHLLGPPPNPVVVRDNTVIPRADDVSGMFNLVASNVVLENIKMTGFDASVVCRDGDRRQFGSTTVRGVAIADTGRGILSLSSGLLTVEDCSFENCAWHGVSVAPKNPLLALFGLEVYDSKWVNPQGAGIYLSNTCAIVHQANISGAWGGGIVAYCSRLTATSCQVTNNLHTGILLFQSNLSPPFPMSNAIYNNLIANTGTDFNGRFGDGIGLVQSDCSVVGTAIAYSARVGIANFGSKVPIANTYLTCNSFDLQGEEYHGLDYDYQDLGGNFCQCGAPPGPCQVTSSTLQAPEMIGGLE